MTERPVVDVEISNAVAVITMASAPANALSVELVEGLDRAVDTAVAGEARTIVFVSAVDRFFAAGADLKLLVSVDKDGFAHYVTRLRALIERIAALPLVTIAAIEGMALGGGLELALACTIRTASPAAELGLPEVKLGLLGGAGGTQRLTRLVGRGPSLDIQLSGRSASGAEAATLGLVDHLFDEGTVAAEAIALAGRLASGPRHALAAIVRCVDAAMDLPLVEGLRVEANEVERLFTTPDAVEGIAAFVEKRQATFE